MCIWNYNPKFCEQRETYETFFDPFFIVLCTQTWRFYFCFKFCICTIVTLENIKLIAILFFKKQNLSKKVLLWKEKSEFSNKDENGYVIACVAQIYLIKRKGKENEKKTLWKLGLCDNLKGLKMLRTRNKSYHLYV